MLAAADPAAQLVQLGDAEAVGVADDHDGGVGHVDPDLDDGGGHEHVGLARGEAPHDGVLVLGRQLAVQHLDPDAGQRARAQLGVEVLDGGRGRQRLGAVVQRLVLPGRAADPVEEMRAQTT